MATINQKCFNVQNAKKEGEIHVIGIDFEWRTGSYPIFDPT